MIRSTPTATAVKPCSTLTNPDHQCRDASKRHILVRNRHSSSGGATKLKAAATFEKSALFVIPIGGGTRTCVARIAENRTSNAHVVNRIRFTHYTFALIPIAVLLRKDY